MDDMRNKQAIYENDGGHTSMLRIMLADGTTANLLFRLASSLNSMGPLKPVALLVSWLNKTLNQCVIGANATFGRGFVLLHPVGVVINSKVVGGENVALESGVVIGDEKGQSPRLGSNIFVGSGAKIIGNVSVGDHAKIGANAVVVKDVPSYATVVGIPARVIKLAEPDD